MTEGVRCAQCNKLVKGLVDHMFSVHQVPRPPKPPKPPPKPTVMVACPECRNKVNEKRLAKHLRLVHGTTPEQAHAKSLIKRWKPTDTDRPYRCQCGSLVQPSLALEHQRSGHFLYRSGYRAPDPSNDLPERESENSVHAWSGGLPSLGKRRK